MTIELPADLPYFVNTLIYGDPGCGKSEYSATYIDYLLKYQLPLKPMKVWLFDPVGKDMPYLKRGKPTDFLDLGDGTIARFVLGKDDQPLFEIEYYFDIHPGSLGDHGAPEAAYTRFLSRIREMEWSAYSAVCLDSLTGFRDSVLRFEQFKNNKESASGKQAHGMQWYAAAGLAIQNTVMSTIAYAPVHSFVPAHVDSKKDDARGFFIYAVAAPGQLSSGIARAFSEVYYLHVRTGEKGVRQRVLQTESGMDSTNKGEYIALSELGAPNFCTPSWEVVTQNIRQGAKQ